MLLLLQLIPALRLKLSCQLAPCLLVLLLLLLPLPPLLLLLLLLLPVLRLELRQLASLTLLLLLLQGGLLLQSEMLLLLIPPSNLWILLRLAPILMITPRWPQTGTSGRQRQILPGLFLLLLLLRNVHTWVLVQLPRQLLTWLLMWLLVRFELVL